ncbi:hypothetical protein ACSTHQ_00465, partial [Vibrio parahaemolyticus]
TGFLADPDKGRLIDEDVLRRAETRAGAALSGTASAGDEAGASPAGSPPTAVGSSAPRDRACPRCNNRTLRREEGCWVCATCGYSRCG